MKKALTTALIIAIGMIVWIVINYTGIAFIKAEFNSFLWDEEWRGAFVFMVFIYICLIPLLSMLIDDELEE